MNLTYTIARYEYISDGKFLVAFNIKDDYENSAYVESQLNSSDVSGKTAQEICQLAYECIKLKVDQLKIDFAAKNNLKIGYQFIPEE